MDKQWMSMDRMLVEYDIGVSNFLNFAIKNSDDPNIIRCPCVKCGNLLRTDVRTVKEHLFCHGMDLTYESWIWHGEDCSIGASVDVNDNNERNFSNDFVEEPVSMVESCYESFVDNPIEFKKLLDDAEKPLYPGCVTFTKLSATRGISQDQLLLAPCNTGQSLDPHYSEST